MSNLFKIVSPVLCTAAFLILFIGISNTSVASTLFNAEEIIDHVKYLASDELEGRMSGSNGSNLAAEYIVNWYENLGLEPGVNGSFYQPFEFTSGVELGDGNEFAWGMAGMMEAMLLKQDFVPVFFSPNSEVSGGLVFVGYGISAQEDEKYDDYAGLNVEGKVVIVLRHEPQTEDEAHFAGKRPTAYSDLRYKAFNAKKHGAVGMIVLTGPRDRSATDEDKLMRLSSGDVFGEAQIPIVHVKRDKIVEALSMFGSDLNEMQRKMDEELTPVPLDMSVVMVKIKTNLIKQYTTTNNVVATLRGTEKPDEYIIISAHYDHIGYGETGTTLLPEEVEKLSKEELIHHGADDNASGTAGVLELAQFFIENGGNRRTLVFINWSAEELGTLGSLHYVKNPVFPLDKTIAMINMDMIGRVKDNTITLQGIGTAVEWTELLDEAACNTDMTLKRFDDGVGGSDYTSFYNVGIPVLNFFSGVHMDYHRPSDTWDKINAEGSADVLSVVADVTYIVDRRDTMLTFQKTKLPESGGAGGVDSGIGYRAYLGSVPDFGFEGEGVLLAGVREGSPAAQGGLLAGDVLIKLGEADIKNLYDLTYALQEHKPGDIVIAVVLRGGVKMEFEVTLGSR